MSHVDCLQQEPIMRPYKEDDVLTVIPSISYSQTPYDSALGISSWTKFQDPTASQDHLSVVSSETTPVSRESSTTESIGYDDSSNWVNFQGHSELVVEEDHIFEPLPFQPLSAAPKDVAPTKPRKNLSPYNYFFQQERQVLLAEMPARKSKKPRKSHGRCGFQEPTRGTLRKRPVPAFRDRGRTGRETCRKGGAPDE